jgi:hypothetical protein
VKDLGSGVLAEGTTGQNVDPTVALIEALMPPGLHAVAAAVEVEVLALASAVQPDGRDNPP